MNEQKQNSVRVYAERWCDIPEFYFSGRRIHWINDGYTVTHDNHGQWFVTFERNQSSVGLNESEFKPSDFYWYEQPLNTD